MWRCGMTTSEYARLGLSERPVSERQTFLGAYGAYRFAMGLTARSSRRGLVGNKLYFDTLLRGAGFPVPQSLAVVGRSGGARLTRLEEGIELRRLLLETEAQFFVKPITAHGETEPIVVFGYDEDSDVVQSSLGDLFPRALFAAINTQMPDGALVQARLLQHEDLRAAIGDSIGSLRLTTFNGPAGPQIVQSFWRIPTASSLADHLWRGNLVAALEGVRVTRVVDRLEVSAPDVPVHPTTGAALLGRHLPHYESACELALRAADFLRDLPLVGWDIALTASGPVILEANSSPSMDLPQYLTGRGVLEDPVLARAWATLGRRRRKQNQERRARRWRALKLQRRR